jgi:hypothetical protein
MLGPVAGASTPSQGPWENLNPGAGGRIQDIAVDPHNPGRAYYLSDMEGLSRTDDHGRSWQYLGRDVAYPNTLTIAIEPGNPDRLYLGSVGGIEVSDDAGETWERVDNIDDPITQIAIDPTDPNHVYAVAANKMRWRRFDTKHIADPFGQRVLYVSRDRGETWQAVDFASGDGRRDTFTIDIDPTNPKRLYLAGLAGLFRSDDRGETWQQLPQPEQTGDCWGADLTPDGKTIYATFQVPDDEGNLERTTGSGSPRASRTKFFAASIDDLRWHEIIGLPAEMTAGENGRVKHFWMPEVDVRSTADEHTLLIASHGDRSGLFEVSVDWHDGDMVDSRWDRVFYYANNGIGADFDFGWEKYATRPLAWQYTPESWGGRGIWTTGDQTLFRADTTSDGWQQDWKSLYTRFVKEMDGVRFYRTRGVQCTFVFDATGDGEYVVQANADNAIKESYDGGFSWGVGVVKPRSNSVEIIRSVEPPVVLAHTSPGWGGSSQQGTLWAKRLDQRSPLDEWQEIGGGPDEMKGLPDTLYERIIEDPHQPGRVAIGTIDAGIYLIDDLDAFLAGDADARRISGTEDSGGPNRVMDKNQGMAFDANQPGRLWAADGQTLYRGDETDGTWTWTRIREGVGQMAAWDLDGTSMLAVVPHSDGGESVEVSADGGETWPGRVDFATDVRPLRDQSWYRPDAYRMKARSPAGHEDQLYIAFADRTKNRPYGYFVVDVDRDGNLSNARDVTQNMPFPLTVTARVIDDGNGPALYVGTWGNGLWRLRLDEHEPAASR